MNQIHGNSIKSAYVLKKNFSITRCYLGTFLNPILIFLNSFFYLNRRARPPPPFTSWTRPRALTGNGAASKNRTCISRSGSSRPRGTRRCAVSSGRRRSGICSLIMSWRTMARWLGARACQPAIICSTTWRTVRWASIVRKDIPPNKTTGCTR